MPALKSVKTDKKLIVGVGSALVDILAHEEDDFIDKTGAIKGGMTYVSKEFIEKTLLQASNRPSLVPGGSACNTTVGVGKLGGEARFVGKCGNGEMGQFFETDLIRQNVEPSLLRSDSPTGRVLSIITPDAQRSMFTFLGASADTSPHDISIDFFKHAAIVHIEGYLLFNPDLILKVLKTAQQSGARISLDLASFNVVQESHDLVEHIVESFVDILIANEDEAQAYTGHRDEGRAIEALSQKAEMAVLKVGERGSFVACGDQIVPIQPQTGGAVIDTTGAGDLWAAGFLYGLVNGYSLERCGKLGSACGYEVCRVIGANIPETGWERIRKLLV
ncbi:MAG: adenosine kinase [Deltaproteobacteria bacterium]|nr:adenosine kinase [Deltaproteobacteria bacterium]